MYRDELGVVPPDIVVALRDMWFPGFLLMVFGSFGAKVRRLVYFGHYVGPVVPLLLAALPFWEVGVLEAELLVAGDRVGCIELFR